MLHDDFIKFQEAAQPYVSNARKTYSQFGVETSWVMTCYNSREAFNEKFPTPNERREAIKRVVQATCLSTEIDESLNDAIDLGLGIDLS